MAPEECKLDRLREQPPESLANAPSQGEKPEHYREAARAHKPDQLSDKTLSTETIESGPTNEMFSTIAGSDTCQELKRPIVNDGQNINKYGSFEGQQTQDARGGSSLQVNGDTKRPSTVSAYIVSKNWKNFGGEANGGVGALEESQKRKEVDGLDEDDRISKTKRTRLERVAKHVPGLGIIMSLIASLFLGTAGMLVKLTTSVHGVEVAVMRAVIQLIIYSAIIGGRGIKWLPERPELIPVALRAALGGLSITFSYSALKLIPLGDATTIRFSLPIWTMIMSYFFLRESCNTFKVFAVAISISGVLLVTKPDMCLMLIHRILNWIHLESNAELSAHQSAYEQARVEELAPLVEAPFVGNTSRLSESDSPFSHVFNQTGDLNSQQVIMSNMTDLAVQPTYSADGMRQFEGCLMALGSSICLSISIIALRLCKRTPSEVSIFWLSALSIIIGTLTLVAMNKWSVPDNCRDVFYILLNGVCGALGQWFMTNALKVEQSGVIALARTFDIEVAFLYSAFFLGEQIRMTSIFGSILVSLGVVSVVVPKWLGCGSAASDEIERESETTAPTPPNSHSNAASSHSTNGSDENHLTTMTSTTIVYDTLGKPGKDAHQQHQPEAGYRC